MSGASSVPTSLLSAPQALLVKGIRARPLEVQAHTTGNTSSIIASAAFAMAFGASLAPAANLAFEASP